MKKQRSPHARPSGNDVSPIDEGRRDTLRRLGLVSASAWALAGSTMMLGMPGAWAAPAWPRGMVKLICAFPPGNSSDLAARVLAKELETRWGKTVIVENHPGASGTIAASIVKDARPDGLTLLMTSTSIAINSAVIARLPYEIDHDFAALNFVNTISAVLLVAPNCPAKNLAELIALAKAKPGALSYGHPGIGTIQNMSAKLFMQKTGTQLTEVPYKGSVEAVTDIIGGRLTMMFEADNSAYGFVKSGKLRALATTGDGPYFGLPDVPTMKQQGEDVDVSGFTVLMAPKGVPADVIAKINKDVNDALATPSVVEGMQRIGLSVAKPPMTAAQTQSTLLVDRSQWETVAKAAGIEAH